MLAVICEHIRAWRSAEAELARARKALDLAERLYDAYQDRQKRQLEEMLTSISRRVAEIYDALHPGEDLSGITVEPWTAKGLELAVDFHGSKQRPPHGVLSESHLNSLAIALFLAMAQTFNQKLRFLVLDDVINSFDLEHRGELAALLAERFDDWQLVVLTHDRQFFDHLARRAPSWKRLEITSWSYEQGPRMTSYRSSGILGEAQERLAQGDVSGAATKARRALEELLQEVCEALAAALPFRRGARNDQREIGELMKGVRRAVKEHAKGMLKELEPLLKHLEADVQATLERGGPRQPGPIGDGRGRVVAAPPRAARSDVVLPGLRHPPLAQGHSRVVPLQVREVRLPAVVRVVIGRRLGHYLVQERLGSGGMGEVYLAEDTKLGRQVALKVLPPEMARDPQRQERFRREAKAVAALKHPNIVTIHSVEEAEGLLFLTLELVEG